MWIPAKWDQMLTRDMYLLPQERVRVMSVRLGVTKEQGE